MDKRNTAHLLRPTAFVPTEQRDLNILIALAWYKMLTTEQVSRLFFPPKGVTNRQGEVVVAPRQRPVSRHAKYRLSKLAQGGYIYWVEQPGLRTGMKPFVAFLTEKGADLVRGLTDYPHELLTVVRPVAGGLPWTVPKLRERYYINELRIRIVTEIAQYGLTLVASHDERMMRRTHKGSRVSYTLDGVTFTEKEVIPDWFYLLSAWGAPFSFTIEVDTGTEAGETKRLDKHTAHAHKVAAYLKWFTKPDINIPSPCELLYPETENETRVLFVTLGKEDRLRHLKTITERLGGKRRFWLTTYERLLGCDSFHLSPVWSVASKEEPRALLTKPV